MILGSSEIMKRIVDGVPARFGVDPYTFETSKVIQYNEKGESVFPLIENLSSNFLIEGVQVDLRLDKLIERIGEAELHQSHRNTGHEYYRDPVEGFYTLEAGKYYLATTMERLNMPLDLMAHVVPRTTMFRSGVVLQVGDVAPNYFGPLTVGMFLHPSIPFVKIERGFRFISLEFLELLGDSVPYCGQWQGGKVSSNGVFIAPR